MTHVIVTFHVDSDDPLHDLGLTNETCDALCSAIAQAGGYDIDFEKVEDPNA